MKWLSTRPTSFWQRGCDDAKAGHAYRAPADGWGSYRNGFDFGLTKRLSNQQIDDAYRTAWADTRVVFGAPPPVEVLRRFARLIQRLTSGVTASDSKTVSQE